LLEQGALVGDRAHLHTRPDVGFGSTLERASARALEVFAGP
jgi:hypothetical protein